MNAPIFRLFALFVRAVRRAGRLQLALGRVRRHSGCARTRTTARVVLEEQRIKRGVIRAADGDGAGRQHARSRGERYDAPLPDRAAVRAAGRLRRRALRPRRAREATTTTRSSAARRSSARIIDSLVEKDRGRRRPADDARPEGAAGRLRRARGPQGRGRGARRQDRRGARAGRHAVVRPERPGHEGSTTSTPPPRASIRRARRSRP